MKHKQARCGAATVTPNYARTKTKGDQTREREDPIFMLHAESSARSIWGCEGGVIRRLFVK
jgi:hypothetical protein